jgi:hypothetical protein
MRARASRRATADGRAGRPRLTVALGALLWGSGLPFRCGTDISQPGQGCVFRTVPKKLATARVEPPTSRSMTMIKHSLILGVVVAMGLSACSSDEISSDEEARRAYFGLDKSIEKSLRLGFDGFNAASSANISPQMTTGTVGGMLTITGQVDKGASDNKGMRLRIAMVDYTDGTLQLQYEDKTVDVDITYNTSTDVTMQPYLELTLRNVPNGTFTGMLTGTYAMKGDIKGDATLMLMFSGMLMPDPANPTDPTKTVRKPGSTTVTGTAQSGDGTYNVNLTI